MVMVCVCVCVCECVRTLGDVAGVGDGVAGDGGGGGGVAGDFPLGSPYLWILILSNQNTVFITDE